jgi:hypothetical protein
MKIIKTVAVTGGFYNWMSGAIGCCAAGAVCLFTAYYFLGVYKGAMKNS